MVIYILRHIQTQAMQDAEETGSQLLDIVRMLEVILSHGTVRNKM